jgi:hypothetical protein
MAWKLSMIAAAAVLMSAQDRPNLVGSWQSQAGGNVSITIRGTQDTLHVLETDGNDSREWTCASDGKNCVMPGQPKDTVSAWYNGPALIVMETRGNDVVKKRLQLSADKSKLEMEVIPIVPPGKTEKIELSKKSQASASR